MYPNNTSIAHNPNSPYSEETAYLIKKAKIAIHLSWSDLKREFLALDSQGISRIPSDRVVDIFRRYHVPLDSEDSLELCKSFSSNKNSHEFDYVKFLKYFRASSGRQLMNVDSNNLMKSIDTSHSTKSNNINTNATIQKIIYKLREKHTSSSDKDENLVSFFIFEILFFK